MVTVVFVESMSGARVLEGLTRVTVVLVVRDAGCEGVGGTDHADSGVGGRDAGGKGLGETSCGDIGGRDGIGTGVCGAGSGGAGGEVVRRQSHLCGTARDPRSNSNAENS